MALARPCPRLRWAHAVRVVVALDARCGTTLDVAPRLSGATEQIISDERRPPSQRSPGCSVCGHAGSLDNPLTAQARSLDPAFVTRQGKAGNSGSAIAGVGIFRPAYRLRRSLFVKLLLVSAVVLALAVACGGNGGSQAEEAGTGEPRRQREDRLHPRRAGRSDADWPVEGR
jgi:hypothetical protein